MAVPGRAHAAQAALLFASGQQALHMPGGYAQGLGQFPCAHAGMPAQQIEAPLFQRLAFSDIFSDIFSDTRRRNRGKFRQSGADGLQQKGDYCELWNRSSRALKSSPAACTAGTGRFLWRKIPFSRAKIVSLQFPRPKIRRILAETGCGGGSGGGVYSPVHRGCRFFSTASYISSMREFLPSSSISFSALFQRRST